MGGWLWALEVELADPYPVVEERSLVPRGRRGLLLGRRVREPGEVPRISGQQVRVFLVDGNLVDHGQRPDDDDLVVRAAHVWVVDMTPDREVQTGLTIPSAEAHEFTVRVTFRCTVEDPVAVVGVGQGDAQRALRGYVLSQHRLYQLGLDHGLNAISSLRLLVQTQIEEYSQLRPPVIPGLRVQLSSVEVHAPEEVAEGAGDDHRLSTLRRDELERRLLSLDLERRRAERDSEAERQESSLDERWKQERSQVAAPPEGAHQSRPLRHEPSRRRPRTAHGRSASRHGWRTG
jgi:hypothetical protein